MDVPALPMSAIGGVSSMFTKGNKRKIILGEDKTNRPRIGKKKYDDIQDLLISHRPKLSGEVLTVDISFISAEKIPVGDRSDQTTDAFLMCYLYQSSRKKESVWDTKSKRLKKSLNPEWPEGTKWEFEMRPLHTCMIEIWDRDAIGTSDLLCVLPLEFKDLLKYQVADPAVVVELNLLHKERRMRANSITKYQGKLFCKIKVTSRLVVSRDHKEVITEVLGNLFDESNPPTEKLYTLLNMMQFNIDQEVVDNLFSDSRSDTMVRVGTKKKDSALRVKVKFIQAADLLAVDKNGYSDPYVKSYVTSDGKKKRTHEWRTKEIRKTLNPVWDEDLSSFTPNDKKSVWSFEISDPEDYVVLEVWDADIIGKDTPLGYCKIEYKELVFLIGNPKTGKWLKLYLENKHKGQIQVLLLVEEHVLSKEEKEKRVVKGKAVAVGVKYKENVYIGVDNLVKERLIDNIGEEVFLEASLPGELAEIDEEEEAWPTPGTQTQPQLPQFGSPIRNNSLGRKRGSQSVKPPFSTPPKVPGTVERMQSKSLMRSGSSRGPTPKPKDQEAHVSIELFSQWLQDKQQEKVDPEQIGILFQLLRNETNATVTSITHTEFINYLYSPYNSIIDPEHLDIHQSLVEPITNYWINSSHNTYLTGAQLGTGLKSNASTDAYISALNRGCRCVELDCWQEGVNSISIKHGGAWTGSIMFKHVVQELDSWFRGKMEAGEDQFPLILSLELHVEQDGRDYLAKVFSKIFNRAVDKGKYLAPAVPDDPKKVNPNEPYAWEYQSGKEPTWNKYDPDSQIQIETAWRSGVDKTILAHGPFLPDTYTVVWRGLGGTTCQINNVNKNVRNVRRMATKERLIATIEDIEADPSPYGLRNKIIIKAGHKRDKTGALDALSLLTGMPSRPFKPKTNENVWHYHKKGSMVYNCTSFSEDDGKRLGMNSLRDFISFNNRQCSRIYPRGSRIDSTNYVPVSYWASGSQLVALNYQTISEPMFINEGLFQLNNGIGYVLKPKAMRTLKDRSRKSDQLEQHFSEIWEYKLRIIDGWKLISKATSHKELPLTKKIQVIVQVYSPIESGFSEVRTEVTDNPYNPLWDATFTFNIKAPQYSHLLFLVLNTEKSSYISYYSLPLSSARTGYRTVPLKLVKDKPVCIPGASLFVHISKGVKLSPERQIVEVEKRLKISEDKSVELEKQLGELETKLKASEEKNSLLEKRCEAILLRLDDIEKRQTDEKMQTEQKI